MKKSKVKKLLTELEEIELVLKKPGSISYRKVWTIGYSPFIMGGDVHGPVGTYLPILGTFPLGEGYYAGLVLSPKGIIHVTEFTSGAFVGLSLEEVRTDVRTGSKAMMDHQIAKARLDSMKVRLEDPNSFWNRFRAERQS
jgi:hypothetical protein